MPNNKNISKLFIFLVFSFFTATANAVQVDSDNRIKTIVYDENDVFTVYAQSGFQTDIELAPNENIDTISIGDSFGWQITPASKRLFVKPLQKSGVTNLTVITNRHTYQFELIAVAPGSRESHAYVVKFYYPDQSNNAPLPIDRTRNKTRPISSTPIPELPGATSSAPTPPPPPIMPSSSGNGSFNYSYTLTGPDSIAPVKIYDDGKSTFFQFKSPPNVQFAYADASGGPVPANPKPAGPNTFVIDNVSSKFMIRDASGQIVTVYNESIKPPQNPTSGAR